MCCYLSPMQPSWRRGSTDPPLPKLATAASQLPVWGQPKISASQKLAHSLQAKRFLFQVCAHFALACVHHHLALVRSEVLLAQGDRVLTWGDGERIRCFPDVGAIYEYVSARRARPKIQYCLSF